MLRDTSPEAESEKAGVSREKADLAVRFRRPSNLEAPSGLKFAVQVIRTPLLNTGAHLRGGKSGRLCS
jgi:hypothetical protein